ncbi:hypothetical protein SAMN03080610_01097 [Afifella marina DSM 2698]|uniref:Short chain dehydrogenase n=2 Tax=Afifella marina TaxID=1080 RepID=A0A1G5MVH2_AFIMA|nr:hypothetical protein SAMN03080610_01097 [Afifella marina DSM 2698]
MVVTPTIRPPIYAGPFPIDVTRADDIAPLRAAIGTFDVIFLVAGVYGPLHNSVVEATEDELSDIMMTNCFGPIRLAHHLLDRLNEGGTLAVMSSHRASIAINTEPGLKLGLYRARNMLAPHDPCRHRADRPVDPSRLGRHRHGRAGWDGRGGDQRRGKSDRDGRGAESQYGMPGTPLSGLARQYAALVISKTDGRTAFLYKPVHSEAAVSACVTRNLQVSFQPITTAP